MLNPIHIHAIRRISEPSEPSGTLDPASCIRFHTLPLGSLFFFRFPYTLILLLLPSTRIITRLTIPLHLSFPLLPFVLDTSDPLMEQGISSIYDVVTWHVFPSLIINLNLRSDLPFFSLTLLLVFALSPNSFIHSFLKSDVF